jgi:hypothetical protein
MAVRKPLVIVGNQIQQLPAGDVLDVPTTGAMELTLTNAGGVSAVIGAPVYISGNTAFQLARSNAAATARTIGLVATSPSIAAAATGVVALEGPLIATTAQWDAVTGQTGGLTAGSAYFLDAAAAGKLTTAAPTTVGQFVAPVGTAIDTITMMIEIDTTILL